MAETNFRQALRISDGSLLIFIQRPICAAMLTIGLMMLITPMLMAFMRKKRHGRQP
jgi:putative tricarboxylic transport membrane protein